MTELQLPECPTKLPIPEVCLVTLIGISGSGKSTFARRHFSPTEIVSSDACRGWVADDENDQAASGDAFDVLHAIVGKRLARRKLTVVDATNVQPEARRPLLQLAREHHILPIAIVLDVPRRTAAARNLGRADRQFGPHVLGRQHAQLRRALRELSREGFRRVHVLDEAALGGVVEIQRERLHNDRRDEHGPFDIIGDVHGCYDELAALLQKLGYQITGEPAAPNVVPPPGRKAVFLGDLVDRGPNVPGVLRLVMSMVRAGQALCVPGNHEVKFARKLAQKRSGAEVQLKHGLAETMAQLESEPESFQDEVLAFIDGLVSHLVLDDGRLVVAHAGMSEALQGRTSGRVREFALYGETTGETDAYGLPVRYDWARDYRGQALVVYGHTPVPEPEWVNRTLCIDTGCVFGGSLTALRYPERELVQVRAARTYYASAKPFPPPPELVAATQEPADVLDAEAVLGRRRISTELLGPVSVQAENAAAALELLSRFGVDPHWLVYLPPTMSPSETQRDGALLEHPHEAFAYYEREGITQVVCQEKHMGSRAVIVLGRTEDAARRRFRAVGSRRGVVLSRTGRPFFTQPETERALLDRLAAACERAGLWHELNTDWLCLDAELMPWSVKAQELVREHYASVGSAARMALPGAVAALEQAAARSAGAELAATHALLARVRERSRQVDGYVQAYARYCWPVTGLAGLRLAPFHLLASEGRVHVDQDHLWHLGTLAKLATADPELLVATDHRVVDLSDETSRDAATEWWHALTSAGGEGMVVKPLNWIARGARGLVQPAIKCRGPEYLRIIYGPEYALPEHLERLRARGLRSKRSLALREFALGVEALRRFVAREPLQRVHECTFAILALESEPIDPRL